MSTGRDLVVTLVAGILSSAPVAAAITAYSAKRRERAARREAATTAPVVREGIVVKTVQDAMLVQDRVIERLESELERERRERARETATCVHDRERVRAQLEDERAQIAELRRELAAIRAEAADVTRRYERLREQLAGAGLPEQEG